jgi:hypothetical protein
MFLLLISHSPPQGRARIPSMLREETFLRRGSVFGAKSEYPSIIIACLPQEINGIFAQVIAFSSQMVYNKPKKRGGALCRSIMTLTESDIY